MSDTHLLISALILGLVEGLTEFLPVSSTGHLILAGQLLGFNDDKGKVFEIVIQFAAILAVVWEYRSRLFHALFTVTKEPKSKQLAVNLIVAFLPSAVFRLFVFKADQALPFQPIRRRFGIYSWRLIDFMGRTPRAHHQGRNHRRHDMERCAESGLCPSLGDDPRHLPFRRDHHRRLVFWLIKNGGGGILLFPRHPHHVCGHTL